VTKDEPQGRLDESPLFCFAASSTGLETCRPHTAHRPAVCGAVPGAPYTVPRARTKPFDHHPAFGSALRRRRFLSPTRGSRKGFLSYARLARAPALPPGRPCTPCPRVSASHSVTLSPCRLVAHSPIRPSAHSDLVALSPCRHGFPRLTAA
jgi:hypothetical protein